MRKIFIKKFCIFLMTAAVGFSLFGCSGGGTADGSVNGNASDTSAEGTAPISADAPSTEENTGVTEILPDTSPITFSLLVSEELEDALPDDEVIAEIAEKTGVTLEISTGDYEEGDELPDLIFAGDNAASLAESGVLIPLDGFVSVGMGDNFNALYGENIDTLRHSDGMLYTVGSGGSSPARFTAEGTFQIRFEVLEELGYPEITTMEQLSECLSQYMENHSRSTGLLLCGSQQQQWEDTVSRCVNYVLGYPDDGDFLVDESGKAHYKWTSEETGEYFKLLNKMYNEGILDDDSFSLRGSAYAERISGGNVLAIGDRAENYPSEEYCPLPVTMGGDKKAMFLAERVFELSEGIGITSGCSAPERAFSFLDMLCGDDMQEIIGYNSIFPVRGLTEKNSAGEFYFPEAVSAEVSEYSDAQRAALEGYGVTTFAELFPQREELPKLRRRLISEYDIPKMSEAGILMETLGTYVKTEVPKAVSAPEEEFDEKWQEITEWCRTNGSELLEELINEMINL